jgi:hypothetical protein
MSESDPLDRPATDEEIAIRFDIGFGKITYAAGAPKNLPRWFWVCCCSECEKIETSKRINGPFRTLREAERDAEEAIDAADGGTPH